MSAADPAQITLNQLVAEWRERVRRGERPQMEDYVARYPELGERIRKLFPTVVVLADLAEVQDVTGAAAPVQPAGGERRPERLGDFRILREVGRGGMGVVYEAEQESLRRRVALKVLPVAARLDARQSKRFEREARAVARLHHTNIVPIFGVGEQDGVPYYVMQFIDGLGLDRVIAELRRLRHIRDGNAEPGAAVPDPNGANITGTLLGEPPADPERAAGSDATVRTEDGTGVEKSSVTRALAPAESATTAEPERRYWHNVARLGMQVADALGYAAGQGVLHRDIKPSNLLLDAHGTVWITDFGLAKATEDGENLTHTGDLHGTLRYMAPERLEGRSDLRSDLYALGLTLYELLTLRPAFPATDRAQLLRQLTSADPVPPRRLDPRIPRDLETIVLKLLARDPEQRYPTAAKLVDDLRRFVEDRPIRARRVTVGERLWRWCRRNPALAALTTSTAVLLLAITAVATTAFVKTSAALKEVDRERRVAQEAGTRAVQERDAANRHLYRSLVGEARALRLARGEGYREQVVSRLRQARQLDTPDRDLGQLRKEAVLSLGDWVGQAPRDLADFHVHGKMSAVAIHPSGALAAFGAEDGTLVLRQLPSDQEIARFREHRADLSHLAFTSDGQRLYSVDWHGELRAWEVDAGGRWGVRPTSGNVPSPIWAFDPDRHLVAGLIGLKIWLGDVLTGKEVGTFERPEAPSVTGAAFSADGKQLAVACAEKGESSPRVQVWDVGKRQLRQRSLPIPFPHYGHMCFSPDGKLLAVCPVDQGVMVFDVGEGIPRALFRSDSVNDVAFTPDSRSVVFTTLTGLVIMGDVTGRTGVPVLQLPGGGRAGRALALTHDGRSLITAGPDGASLRELTVPEKLVLAGHGGGVPTVAISPDGTLLASGSKDRTVVLWDTATGRRLRALAPFHDFVQSVAFSPDGRWLVTGDWGSGIKVWDVATLRQVAAPAHRLGGAICAVQFSGDGKYLAATGNGLQVWRLQPKEAGFTLESVTFQPGSRSLYLQASADGRWLAWVNHSVQLHLWDLKEQRARAVAAPPLLLGWHNLALHPEGRWVGSVSRDRVAEFWTLDPPSRAFTLGEPGEFTSYHVAASPDGRWFAADPRSNAVTVWNTTHRQDRLDFPPESSAIWSVALGPRGDNLALGMSDGGLVLWRLSRVRSFLEEAGLGEGR